MLQATRRNPFAAPGVWLKGGIHIHTTNSDGIRAPEEALEIYRQAGYEFLVFGDHWRITTPPDPRGKIIVIPGAEYDAATPEQAECYHFMAAGMRAGQDGALRALQRDPPGMARALAGMSEYLIVAHPYWSSLTTELVARLTPARALEVYNHGCEVDQGLGFSMYVWDQLLSRGGRWDAVAVDDSHFRSRDFCGGWVMAKAGSRSAEGILVALKAGDFYSTMGPEILSLEFFGQRGVRLRCTPAARVMFRCDRAPGVNRAAEGGQLLTHAEWELPEKARLVRIELTDPAGRKAWTNPFYLAGAFHLDRRRHGP